MSCTILDGKLFAAEWREEIARDAADFSRTTGIIPCLAVVLVGENPASVSYVTAKGRACREVGIESQEIRLPENTSQAELLDVIDGLNADEDVHGILVQLPLPKQIDTSAVIASIAPEKDVDGFTPTNVGKLFIGEEDCFIPCTPFGIIQLLCAAGIKTAGKHAVVIGRSNIVGKPIAALLSRKAADATVTLCHTGTKNLADFTREADILVVAVGRPNVVTPDMIKPGAAVIDVGVNRIADPSRKSGFRLVGDVAEGAENVAGWLTPVPGGVGPLTITMLLRNTLLAAGVGKF